MKRRRLVWGLAGAGLALGGLLTLPARAASGTGDASEGWYDTSGAALCSSPVGCPPITVPADNSSAGTLQVGVLAGQETARTYVLPDLSAYLGGPLPTSGTMTLPVDTASGGGTVNQAAATIEACLASAPFTNGAEGSTAPPPSLDCKVHASLVNGSTSFTLDLGPFLAAWAAGAPQDGIGLIPDPAQTTAASTWRVAFNGRNLAGAPHISSTFGLPPQSTPASTESATPAAQGSVPPVTTSVAPASPPAVTPVPVGPVASAPASPPQIASAAPPATSPAASAATGSTPGPAGTLVTAASRGFQYPEILLLPLVLAGAVVFVLRLFTSDATPRYLRATPAYPKEQRP